ncbi:MAG TPA: hypothetical protein VE075_05225, partial [Thermoanaerobaculia bacterium]|nr:hypothetical protein [Thermoanaerobaculia bacterium]
MSSLVESSQWIAPQAPPAAAAAPANAGGRQRIAAGVSVVDGWLRLAGETVRLPLRLFGLGLELLGRTGQQSRRVVGGGVPDAVSQGYDPAAPLAAPNPWALRTPLTPAPSASPLPQNAVQGPLGPQTGAAGGPAVNFADTQNRKETPMSCSACDPSATTSSELKIIQYSIVNVDPYIEDCDLDDDGEGPAAGRVIYSGTLSTTQDLSDADLTAWVIAMYFQRPDHKRLRHCEKQYLRVCSFVECRVPMPRPNYQQ